MAHTPLVRILDGADTAVVLIHGILGTPDQFASLLPLIPRNCSVDNLLLPGHGGSVRDFARSSMNQWKVYVHRRVSALAKTHQRILLVGHSMGSLLAIHQALHPATPIDGLFLMAVPLQPRLHPSAALRSLQAALVPQSSSPALQQVLAATSIRTTRQLWQYLGWVPRYMELFRQAREARQEIRQLCIPCVAVQSGRDELVSARSCRYLQGLDHVQLLTLPQSGHFVYPPQDLAALQKAFTAFCRRFQN